MFLIHPFQRSVLYLLIGLIVAALIFRASSIFAFQSFEEFSRSRNNISSIDVTPSADPVEAKPGENFDLHLWVKLSQGWHIYSLEPQGKDESLATQIRFNENVFQTKNHWTEPEPIITLDGALDKVVKVHKDAVRFSRNLRVPSHLKPGTYSISGRIEFRACDNKICSLPREVGFKKNFRVLGDDEGF
jgi:DsbC/DsbD-like thiol-disulfide interchange protein